MKKLMVLLSILLPVLLQAQQYSKTLLKADKLYIKKQFAAAAGKYEKYLHKHPKDFYASRQAALCYDKLNQPNMAIDYWPAVIENSEATENDNLQYARCLLANYRSDDARRVFVQLSHSSDKAIAAWGKAYMNTFKFYKDSALCKVTAVNDINTMGSEFAPVLWQSQLVYSSDAAKSPQLFTVSNAARSSKLMAATKTDSTHFSNLTSFNNIKAANTNGNLCFSADGNTIYYSSVVPVKTGKTTLYKFQLYSAASSGPAMMQVFKHNQPVSNFMHPCLSKDGTKLYFASDMKGSLGGMDIFVCELMNGDWSTPKNLGAEINTSGNEVWPYAAEDGSLYFASDMRPGLGGLDIFVAKPAPAKPFEEAVNAGSPINTQFNDFGILLLPGTKCGYLSSNRNNNGDDDIFYFRDGRP